MSIMISVLVESGMLAIFYGITLSCIFHAAHRLPRDFFLFRILRRLPSIYVSSLTDNTGSVCSRVPGLFIA